jgi:hypothetical protein
MQATARFGNRLIHRQDSSGKARLHALLQPCLQHIRFLAVVRARQFDAEADLKKRDGAEEATLRLLCGLPSGHADIAPRRFPQLGHHIGIEQEQRSVLQDSRTRLLHEGRNFQVDGTRFLISEHLEQSFFGPSGSRGKTKPLPDQIGNPSGQGEIRIDRPMPRLAAEGVIQLDGHVHDCTVARLHGHSQALP